MKKNIFTYLRKKIISHSIVTEEKDDIFHVYKIESLGFSYKVSFPTEFPSLETATNLLIDKLVENADYLKKLEQVETRKSNLKTLLD